MTIKRWRCDACRWIGASEEMLRAPNPFDLTETIEGCPRCHTIEDFELLCERPGCDEPATCGTATPDGYKHTCGRHLAT